MIAPAKYPSMKRLPAAGRIGSLALLAIPVAFIIRSVVFIWQNYFIIFFWDQWNNVDDLMTDPVATTSWTYLFKPHNEHIIATSKILFVLDRIFFHFANLPLVIVTMVLTLLVAWLLTVVVFWERERDRSFWTVWLIFCASGFSVVQWENLLWGFQSQFALVLIGALASIIAALEVSKAADSKNVAWLAVLQLAIGFCVFSMGNGILIPIPVLFLLILLGAATLACLATTAFSIFYIAIFFVLVHGRTTEPPLSLTTLLDIARFFLIMIGGAPFDTNLYVAATLGALLIAAIIALFVRYLVLPWFKGHKADPGLSALFALAAFLLLSAAAATRARFPHGDYYALTSRYATPMLALWMTVFAIPMRLLLTSQIAFPRERFRHAGLSVVMAGALAVVAVSTLRSTNGEIGESRDLRQAAYFAASDVFDPDLTGKFTFYGDKAKLHIAFLRDHQLNIFSPWMGLPKPSVGEVRKLSSIKTISVCAKGYIDKTTKLDAVSWKSEGWISDAGGRTPRMIVASDGAGRLLGFTAPLTYRPDVEQAIGAHHFRGFLLPLRVSSGSQKPHAIIAFFGDGGACRLDLPNPWPD